MKKYEGEEYNSSEIQIIDEIQIFAAEDYKIIEHIDNSCEEFKTLETEKRVVDETPKVKKTEQGETIRKKLNNIKSSINTTATSAVSTTVALVAAVGVGVVSIEPISDDFGILEFTHYYVDYKEGESSLAHNVSIHFDKDLNEDFYTIVINEETKEEKQLLYDYVSFSNVSNETSFQIKTLNKIDKVVNSFEVIIDTQGYTDYLGVGNMEYDLISNDDGTHSLTMSFAEYDEFLVPHAYLTDLTGNELDYTVSLHDEMLIIDNIKEEEFDIKAALYKNVNNNYYSTYSYEIKEFNVNHPNKVNLKRVEILNSTYSSDGSIPTQLYFDGYLSENDRLEVEVYNEGEELLAKLEDVDIRYPVILSDLPSDELITFEYTYYHYGNIIGQSEYQTTINIPEQYLNIEYSFGAPNPLEALITYNEDGTYNAYYYNGFSSSSEYDVVCKTELAVEMVPYYEYIGKDTVSAITNIEANQFYVIIHKVLVRDGINYYSIYDYYMPSGGLEITTNEDSFELSDGLTLEEIETKKYQLNPNSNFGSDFDIVATLSTGEVIELQISKDDVNDFENLPIIDLSAYDYENVSFAVTIKHNPNFGSSWDNIFDSGIKIQGSIFIEYTYIFEF